MRMMVTLQGGERLAIAEDHAEDFARALLGPDEWIETQVMFLTDKGKKPTLIPHTAMFAPISCV